jgi:hypothetical protein
VVSIVLLSLGRVVQKVDAMQFTFYIYSNVSVQSYCIHSILHRDVS